MASGYGSGVVGVTMTVGAGPEDTAPAATIGVGGGGEASESVPLDEGLTGGVG
jgi:hypothetical protein